VALNAKIFLEEKDFLEFFNLDGANVKFKPIRMRKWQLNLP